MFSRTEKKISSRITVFMNWKNLTNNNTDIKIRRLEGYRKIFGPPQINRNMEDDWN